MSLNVSGIMQNSSDFDPITVRSVEQEVLRLFHSRARNMGPAERYVVGSNTFHPQLRA